MEAWGAVARLSGHVNRVRWNVAVCKMSFYDIWRRTVWFWGFSELTFKNWWSFASCASKSAVQTVKREVRFRCFCHIFVHGKVIRTYSRCFHCKLRFKKPLCISYLPHLDPFGFNFSGVCHIFAWEIGPISFDWALSLKSRLLSHCSSWTFGLNANRCLSNIIIPYAWSTELASMMDHSNLRIRDLTFKINSTNSAVLLFIWTFAFWSSIDCSMSVWSWKTKLWTSLYVGDWNFSFSNCFIN